ncbi:ATP-dependent DNA ligase [Shewanella sp. NFH-SH190041]|uniref:DNA ligase n=1 Tax=Shewanella sp. NFH-SH190041 TaxID=2950245 RepID=UPI0021C44770|nr:DNA ligase [Shewanella sp. NFH-SH190041]BDM64619.1 ATP-dependent DNA ligase [Shewanella sp. NFH-SH190041]
MANLAKGYCLSAIDCISGENIGMCRYWVSGLLLLLALSDSLAVAAERPAVQLASRFSAAPLAEIQTYFISEKYDGVRGFWTGQQMLSRSGRVIPVPDWFTASFPNVPLDGEIWLGRGRFNEVSALVRRHYSQDDPLWQQVKFMVFDLSGNNAPFGERYKHLGQWVDASPYLQIVPQFKVNSLQQLDTLLAQYVADGAEGLMLHHRDAHYQQGRSRDLIKLKLEYDAEATVIGHIPGKGKYTGMLGALQVIGDNGKQFNLGTGFSDAERRMPPPIGAVITYRYRGLTANGLPRFASFLRIRAAQ